MSNTEVWTIDNAIYEYAKQNAKARSQKQWSNWMTDPNSVNLWITQFTEQNPNWYDPWFENELDGFYNGAATASSPEAYEVTQNAYFIYCWLQAKGYGDYAIQAFLTVVWNECRMGMGCWEGKLCPWSFNSSTSPQSLIGFIPYRTGESGSNYDNDWYQNQQLIQGSYASALDEVTHITYTKYRPSGSWAAYHHWELQTYTDPDTGLERVTLVDGEPVFYITPGTQYAAIGYGMVQWTNWTRLVIHANMCVPTYGINNWQFNSTLQLMVLEWERQTAMSTPASQQYGGDYHGEWVNNNAPQANFVYNGVIYYYPASCSWDDWADGTCLLWVESKCAELGITDEGTIDYYKRLITIDIICRCYLHAGSAYHDNFSRLQDQNLYFGGAISYWNDHGGGDIADVPRPRDIPDTELDKYHLSQRSFMMLAENRRRRKRVVTILF